MGAGLKPPYHKNHGHTTTIWDAMHGVLTSVWPAFSLVYIYTVSTGNYLPPDEVWHCGILKSSPIIGHETVQNCCRRKLEDKFVKGNKCGFDLCYPLLRTADFIQLYVMTDTAHLQKIQQHINYNYIPKTKINTTVLELHPGNGATRGSRSSRQRCVLPRIFIVS